MFLVIKEIVKESSMHKNRVFFVLSFIFCGMILYCMDRSPIFTTPEEALKLLHATPINQATTILDSSGYYKAGDELIITAPYFFLNLEKIPEIKKIKTCTVQLHTMLDSTQELNVAALLAKLPLLSSLIIRNMPVKKISFPSISGKSSFLKSATITHTELESLNLSDFTRIAPKLETLNVSHNKIKNVFYDKGMSEASYALQKIDVSHNCLEFVSLDHILRSSQVLKKVNCSNNPLKEIYVPSLDRYDCDVYPLYAPRIKLYNVSLSTECKQRIKDKAFRIREDYDLAKPIYTLMFSTVGIVGAMIASHADFKMMSLMITPILLSSTVASSLTADYVCFPKEQDRIVYIYKPEFDEILS